MKNYLYDNNFVYWQKEISYAHIFIRELTKTINIIINTLLIAGVFLTLTLIYVILDGVQFEPTYLLDFLITPSKYNFWLYLLIMFDMGLYYRLTVPAIREKKQLSLLKSKETYTKHNIADSLSQETSNIIDKAWLYAQHGLTIDFEC